MEFSLLVKPQGGKGNPRIFQLSRGLIGFQNGFASFQLAAFPRLFRKQSLRKIRLRLVVPRQQGKNLQIQLLLPVRAFGLLVIIPTEAQQGRFGFWVVSHALLSSDPGGNLSFFRPFFRVGLRLRLADQAADVDGVVYQPVALEIPRFHIDFRGHAVCNSGNHSHFNALICNSLAVRHQRQGLKSSQLLRKQLPQARGSGQRRGS